MSSKRAALFGLVLCLSCTDMTVYRSSQDYFPLVLPRTDEAGVDHPGSWWKYLTDYDTTYYDVVGESAVGGLTATVMTVDYDREHALLWVREPTRIIRFFHYDTTIGGHDYTFEQRYGLVYLLPLVEGSSWYDEYRDTVLVLGTDTVFYYRRLDARVAAVEEVGTPAGSFSQCYRLEFREERRGLDSTTVSYTEWLAPGVGLVQSQPGSSAPRPLAQYEVRP